jgi:aspartyl-tRNA(Asn)/glutamyl-tRNA(Gln) amidotransferase subunit A
MLQAIVSHAPNDTPHANVTVPNYALSIASTTSSLRIGFPHDYFYDELDPEIKASMESALLLLKSITASQQDLPPLATDATYSSWMVPYSAMFLAEAYSYHKEFIASSPDLYQPATLKRLRAGADVSASTYIQAKRQLEYVRHSVGQVFDQIDLLITPTVRIPPHRIEDLQGDPDSIRAKELEMLHTTRPINFTGLPTISVPCGFTLSGLPIGMQITGPAGCEAQVLSLAYAYEQATEWHTRKPSLS